jgi:hypothetical protein
MRTLNRNFFCFTTFQKFECWWPLKGRKKGKKIEIFLYFGDFFKSWSPKIECLYLFDASNKTDKKKITLDLLWWSLWSNFPRTLDQKWPLLPTTKIDTQNSNEHISSSWIELSVSRLSVSKSRESRLFSRYRVSILFHRVSRLSILKKKYNKNISN